MAKKHIDEGNQILTYELETPEGYQCFRTGINDSRAWRNHPETDELRKIVSENTKHSRIFVKYGNFTKRIK